MNPTKSIACRLAVLKLGRREAGVSDINPGSDSSKAHKTPGAPLFENPFPKDDPRHSVLAPYFEALDEFRMLAEEYPDLSIDWIAASGTWLVWPPPRRALANGESTPFSSGGDLHVQRTAGQAAERLLNFSTEGREVAVRGWLNLGRDRWLRTDQFYAHEFWMHAIREFWLDARDEVEASGAHVAPFEEIRQEHGYSATNSTAIGGRIWTIMVTQHKTLREVMKEQQLSTGDEIGHSEEVVGWIQNGKIAHIFKACQYFVGVLAARRVRQVSDPADPIVRGEGTMSKLPDLPDRLQRLHALRWSELVRTRAFTGDHLKWHQSRDRRRAAARPKNSLAPPPIGGAGSVKHYDSNGEEVSYDEWHKQQLAAWKTRESDPSVIDSIGIGETTAFAKARFESVIEDYFAFWAEVGGDSDDFVQWLEDIASCITREVSGAWSGEWHAQWFERACREKVEETLKSLKNEWRSKASKVEILHLENPHLSLRSIVAAKGDLKAAFSFNETQKVIESAEETLRRWHAANSVTNAGQTISTQDHNQSPHQVHCRPDQTIELDVTHRQATSAHGKKRLPATTAKDEAESDPTGSPAKRSGSESIAPPPMKFFSGAASALDKRYADMNAIVSRRLGRNHHEAYRQEELLKDARAWSKPDLRKLVSEIPDVLEVKDCVVKKTWDEFVQKHRYRGDFQLTYREFASALWCEGSPSLEDLARVALEDLGGFEVIEDGEQEPDHAVVANPQSSQEFASTVDSASGFDFATEEGRTKAIRDYTTRWSEDECPCSEACLARTANVNPADLSKWKKARLPPGSDKAARIARVLTNNEPPTRAPGVKGDH